MPGSFVFDANRCTGCGACRLACTIENRLPPDFSWRRIETFNPRRLPAAPLFHLSLACNHCAEAACMHACPTLAYRRDQPTGAVLLDSDRCMGCRYCAWACPYDAPVVDAIRGVMTKCTWCDERLRTGLKPGCATHCPTGALDYAEAPATPPPAVPGFPSTTLGPRMRVVPLRPDRLQPAMTAPGPAIGLAVEPSHDHHEISLKGEWSLAAFTLIVSVLVALVTAAATGAVDLRWWQFAPMAVLAFILGSIHLGRQARAWRAVLNVRHSWLSREIALTSAFVVIATFWLAGAPGGRALGWAASLVGFAALVATDALYGVLPGGAGFRHSAGALWTGSFLAAVFAGELELATVIGASKLWLYLARRRFAPSRRPAWTVVRVLRAGGGLVVPFVLWALAPSLSAVAVILVLAGEAIDRGEYYDGLEPQSPRRQMDLALSAGYPSTFVTGSSRTPSPAGAASGSTGAPAINVSAR